MPDENKFFLASFPRSGNTWVRFLIANVYNNLDRKFEEIDFHNIHEIVPEYGSDEKPFFSDFPKVFKTHERHKIFFKNTILLLRNPCDILYSYRDFLNKNRGLSLSLEDTVRHEKYGIKAIASYPDSFIKHCENVLIIVYEKLHENPVKELKKIFDFLELIVPDDIIQDAVQKSSFRMMDRIEREKGRKYGNTKLKHIRSGKIGDGVATIKKNDGLYQYVTRESKKSPLLYFLYF